MKCFSFAKEGGKAVLTDFSYRELQPRHGHSMAVASWSGFRPPTAVPCHRQSARAPALPLRRPVIRRSAVQTLSVLKTQGPPSEQQQQEEKEARKEARRLPGSTGPVSLKHVVQEMEGMGHADTDLKSKPIHYFWVGSACLALLTLLGRGLLGSADISEGLSCLCWGLLGYVLADAATGFYHFGVDNYGSAKTPVFGSQIDAFQGHHRRPWTITKREFANNLHALARPVFLTCLVLLFLPASASRDTFNAVFFACVMFSQQFHAWAHAPRPLLPPVVVKLQDAGVLVSRKMHGAHHRPPFSGNYCIVSGLCNMPLDGLGVFAALEKLIFVATGVPPRSWSSAAPEWLEGNELAYYEDGSDCIE